MNQEWKKLGGLYTNYVLTCEGFHVSYNPHTQEGYLGDVFRGDSAEETALCVDDKYYVLNGNWKSEFEKANDKGGLDGCMAMYKELAKQHASVWTME